LKKKAAQSLGEYTTVIAIMIAAIISMLYFTQRGLSARINDARGYALTTLDSEIKDIHLLRGGNAYSQVLAEYEPYYTAKETNTRNDTDTFVSINGISKNYSRQASSEVKIKTTSTEGFARDDDYSE